MTEQTDVHTEHCCKIHGCKYMDDDCTVVNGEKRQSYPCETCERTVEDFFNNLMHVHEIFELYDIKLKVKR